MQIKEFNEKTVLDGSEKILVQDDFDDSYKWVKSSKFMAGTGGSSSSVPAVAANALKVNYDFLNLSGTQLTDLSPNALHGTFGDGANSSTMPSPTGWLGIGLDFNGSGQFVTLPADNWFGGEFTFEVSALIRENNNWARFFECGIGPDNYNVLFVPGRETSGRPYFYNHQSGGSGFNSQRSVETWKFHHYCYLLKADGFGELYVDNLRQETGFFGLPTAVSRNKAYIGKSLYSGDAYLNGIMVAFRIYSKALTAAERCTNYAATKQSLAGYGISLV